MKHKKKSLEKMPVFFRSAAAGALMFRGVPMAAISAGWELSASVGVRTGELLSVIIFLLGSSAVLIAHELPDSCIRTAVKLCAAMIYAYSSAGMNGSALIRLADCLIICLSLLMPEAGKRGIITACAFSAVSRAADILKIGPPAASAVMPLAAALISGTAAVLILNEGENSKFGFFAGSAAVMLLDTFR